VSLERNSRPNRSGGMIVRRRLHSGRETLRSWRSAGGRGRPPPRRVVVLVRFDRSTCTSVFEVDTPFRNLWSVITKFLYSAVQ